MSNSLKDTVLNPLTVAASVVTAVLSSLWLPLDPGVLAAFGATMWANAGTLFTSGTTLAVLDRYEILGVGWLQPAALALIATGGGLYVVKLLDRFLDDFQDRL